MSENHTTPSHESRFTKIYPDAEVFYNHSNNNKAGICILFPKGLIQIDKSHDIVPGHVSYVDFCLKRAQYRL